MKISFMVVSIILAVVAVGAGVGYSIRNNPAVNVPPLVAPRESPAPVATTVPPPREPPELTVKPTPPPLSQPAPSPSPPPTLEQKIEGFKKAMAEVCATGERREITLVFTEAEANKKAAELLTTTPMPADIPLRVESLRVEFQSDNQVLTEADSIIYDRLRVTIKVVTRFSIEGGKPKVEITRVSFGFVPLPQVLRDRIVGLLTARIDELQNRLSQSELGCGGKLDLSFKMLRIQQKNLTVAVAIERRA